MAIKIAALPEMEKREDRQGEALKGKAAKPYRAVVDTNGSESLAVGCCYIGMGRKYLPDGGKGVSLLPAHA